MAFLIKIDVERSGGRIIVLYEVCNVEGRGAGWTSEWLAIGHVRDIFTFHAILLVSEGVLDKIGSNKLVNNVKMNVKDLEGANLYFNFCHLEGVIGITGGICLFYWSEEKIESHPNAIDDRSIVIGVSPYISVALRIIIIGNVLMQSGDRVQTKTSHFSTRHII